MDVLSFVFSYALAYAATSYDYTTTPTVNWTAINATTWWTSAQQSSQDIGVHSAKIEWSDSMITDLKTRLDRNVSYVAPLEGVGFKYGFNRDQLANWTSYWSKKYNFTARLTAFNKFPMYKTNIQGLDIFYIRVTPKVTNGQEIVPLLMLHGFPSSIREYFEAIPLITAVSSDRDYAVELIIPCLPGYGYSSAPTKVGFGAAQAAVVMRSLMLRLGYSQYYVQGGDIGSVIAGNMATLFPDEVLGYHTNWGQVMSPIAVILQIIGYMYSPLVVDSAQYDRMYPVYDVFTRIMDTIAYLHHQATKPETLGVGLLDSPAGLLAYCLDIITSETNFDAITSGDGGIYSHFTQQQIIDTLMMYWAPGVSGTAFRMYAESFNIKQMNLRLNEIETYVPTRVLQPKHALSYQSPTILRLKYKNLLSATVLENGGHFIALEQPKVFASDVLDAITAFRKWHTENYFVYPDNDTTTTDNTNTA